MLKLSLLHKGLILVSIPLCFEITVFGVLINLQDQLEREAQRINQNKKVNDSINLIMRDGVFVSNAMQLNAGPFINTSFNSKKIAENVADIRRRFEELKILCHDDPAILKRIDTCMIGMQLILVDINNLKARVQAATTDELPDIIRNTRDRLDKHVIGTLRAGLFELADASYRSTDDVYSKRIWEKIRVLLKTALGLSAMLALAGTIVFSKHLVSRLSRLSDNADRLAKGKPLLPLVGGNDEITELDKNFHYAAELIEAAKKMRQEVTAMITHDLKTPLQSVRSFLEMLQLGRFTELNEQGVALLSTTQDASDHMVGLIDNVLQLEKLRSGAVRLETKPIELIPLLDRCLDSVKLLAEEKNVRLTETYSASNPGKTNGDAFWLEQVFVNILSNAIKFTAKNSTVSIDAVSAKDLVEIRIKDQGPGISADDQKLIFDRFHRLQSADAVAGTGLGLPIAKELIELHHGSISVESELGKGSTFALRLPHLKSVVSGNASKVSPGGVDSAKSDFGGKRDTGAKTDIGAFDGQTTKRPPRKRFRLTLLHKGLLLISIPLFFEVTMFGVLINLQDKVELETKRISRNKEFNDSANRIMRDLVALGTMMHRYRFDVCLDTNRFDGGIAEIKQNVAEMKRLSNDNPSVIEHVRDTEKGIDLLYQDIAYRKTIPKSTKQEFMRRFEQKVKIEAQVKKLLTVAIVRLGDRSIWTDAQFDLRSSQIRAQSRILLKWALGLSVLFALGGAALYSKHLVGRLERLSANANKLAKNEPLLTPIGGSDEVAELDANFHAAAELIEAAKRMRQEVTAMITHDLKTPLQSVRSFLEMLKLDCFGKLDKPGMQLLEIAQNASEHMVGLINSVLQLEKLRTGNVQLQTVPIELAPLLDQCIGSVKLLAEEKGVTIALSHGQPDFVVNGDAFWLEQVFVNILSNAIKFTSANSTVSVSAHNSDNRVEIRILDRGPGIPEKDLKLIFDRFHRVQSSASVPGTGLGLPIAKELIELHHGSIGVESTVGKGSTFILKLPLSTVLKVVKGEEFSEF